MRTRHDRITAAAAKRAALRGTGLLPVAVLFGAAVAGAGCGPALELIDQGILLPSGELPFVIDDLPAVSQERLEVRARVDGVIAETTLQLNREDGTFEGELPFSIDADADVEVRVEILSAYDAVSDPVLLAWALVEDVTLRSRDEVPVEVTGFEDAPIDAGDGEDAARIGIDNRRLDLNRNEVSNLADLIDRCDPDVPPLALRLSATDLQFPSGAAPGETARQVIVLDSQREAPVAWWAQVVGAPGAGIGPLEVDSLLQPAPQGRLGDEAEPNMLGADDEALIAVSYSPTDTRISTGFVIVETLDRCGVRQAGSVRLIGNPDGPLPAPLPGDAYATIEASLTLRADNLGLNDVPVDIGATRNLLTGQQLPVDALTAGEVGVELADLPLRAAALLRVPAGTDVGVALVDLRADADLVIAELADDGALGELTVISHPGTDPESASLLRTDADRDLFVGVLDASIEGDDTASYALFFRAASVARLDPYPVTPNVGPRAGGTPVTITGAGFEEGATVAFAGQPAGDVVIDASGTSLTATTPEGALFVGTNPATVTVTNPAFGQAEPQVATAPAAFFYAPDPPVIDGVDPPSVGVDADPTPLPVITIDGDGFTTFFGPLEVEIGGALLPASQVVRVDQQTIQATLSPQTSAGVFDVLVRVQGPEGPIETTLVGGFEVVPPLPSPPSLSGISPASGPSDASLPITVTGADFAAGAQVLFNGAARPTSFVSDASLTAITPSLDPGNVAVTVRNPDGQVSASGLTYVVFEASADVPVISAVTPGTVHAAVAGDVITLFGQALNAQTITDAVVDDGAGGETDLTVLSVVGSFVSARIEGGLPTSASLLARLTYEDGTEVSSPTFSSSPPAVFAAQTSGGSAVAGVDFVLVVAGDQLFPSRIDTVTLTGPSTLSPTLVGSSETTLQLAVTGAVQGIYALELVYDGGHTVTLPVAVAVAGDCGDGVKTPDEACDGTDFGTDSCAARGYFGGQLTCTADCLVDVAACTSCGDGARDAALGESCDGADLDGATCASLSFDDGDLACTAQCTFDASGCSLCGDGVASGLEACDGIDVRGATCLSLGYAAGGPVTCREDCAAVDVLSCETCGDGVCTGTEDNASCPGDCAATCNDGNNTCDMGEDCSTCPIDCDLCAPYTAVVDGDGQSATIGLSLPLPITVTVTDDQGAPVEGATISFSHPVGGLSTGDTDNVSTTNTSGIATATVRLGFGPGDQSIVVSGVGPAGVDLLGLPATLTFTGEDVPAGTVYTIANAEHVGGWAPHPTGSALLSRLNSPHGIAAHPDGGAVVAIDEASRVVHISAEGVLSVIAGNGSIGIDGEGGPAIDAPLNRPRAVAVADDGTVYIGTRNQSSNYGSRVWRVDPVTQVITTYAGGEASFADLGNGRTATDANIEWPHDLAIDPLTGDLLIFPGGYDQTVRRVDVGTGTIDSELRNQATCETSGLSTSLPATNAMSVGPDGVIYLANSWNVDGCSIGGETIMAFKPDGFAVSISRHSGSQNPQSMAVDPAGNLFHWAFPAHELRKLDRLGRITTIVGNGVQQTTGEYVPGVEAGISRIEGIAVMPNGDLWFTDSDSHSVRVVRGVAATGPEPLPSVSFSLIDPGPFSAEPMRAVSGGVGVVATASGGVDGVKASAEPVTGHLVDQPSLLIDGASELLFYPHAGLVPATETLRVVPLTREWEAVDADELLIDVETLPATGGFLTTIFNPSGTNTQTSVVAASPLLQLSGPVNTGAVGPDGSITLADASNNRLFRIGPDGALTHLGGDGTTGSYPAEATDPRTQPIGGPIGVEVTPAGDVFVSVDFGPAAVLHIDADDGLIRRFAGGGSSDADGIAAITAEFATVYKLHWDDDLQRLYIAHDNRLRYVEGGVIYSVPLQVGGCSIFTLNGLTGMPNGHLAVAAHMPGCMTFNNQRAVLEVDPATGAATELLPDFTYPAAAAQADGLAVADDGTLYFELTDTLVRKTPDGTYTVLTGPETYSINNADAAIGTVPVGPLQPVGGPTDLQLGVDGSLYIFEPNATTVRMLSGPDQIP